MKNRFFIFILTSLCTPWLATSMDIQIGSGKRFMPTKEIIYGTVGLFNLPAAGFCGESVLNDSNKLLQQYHSGLKMNSSTEAIKVKIIISEKNSDQEMAANYQNMLTKYPEMLEQAKFLGIDILESRKKTDAIKTTDNDNIALPTYMFQNKKRNDIIMLGTLHLTLLSDAEPISHLRKRFCMRPFLFVQNEYEINKLIASGVVERNSNGLIIHPTNNSNKRLKTDPSVVAKNNNHMDIQK